ncbi:MAG: hypothetical protein QM704_21435 [Anaeromyxobacteraceae bacterium]
MRRLLVVPSVFVAALAIAGCGRPDVAHYRVPKEAAQPASAGAMGGGMGGGPMMGGGGTPPAGGGGGGMAAPSLPDGAVKLAWKLPARWTQEVGGGGMRYATLRAPVQGKVDVSVTFLPGDAGGELANVNRWRGQIGLAPIDDAALAKARSAVQTPAGAFNVYDFASEGQGKRLVAGLGLVDGNSWFVKMTGEAAPVAAARPDFLEIVRSLRREASN